MPAFQSLQEVHDKHMAGWRVVGESCRRPLCWLMVTEMTDNSRADSGVTLLAKQSEDQTTDAPSDMKVSRAARLIP